MRCDAMLCFLVLRSPFISSSSPSFFPCLCLLSLITDLFLSGQISPESLASRLLARISSANASTSASGKVAVVNFVMRLCGAEGNVLPTEVSSLDDIDVIAVVEQIAEAMGDDSSSERRYALPLTQVPVPRGVLTEAGTTTTGGLVTASGALAGSAAAAAGGAGGGKKGGAKQSATASTSSASDLLLAGGVPDLTTVGDPSIGMEGFFAQAASAASASASAGSASSLLPFSAEFPSLRTTVDGELAPANDASSSSAADKPFHPIAVRRRLAIFWLTLIARADIETLLTGGESSDSLLDLCYDLLSRFSSLAGVRHLRHFGVFSIMVIGLGMLAKASAIDASARVTQRQYNAEKAVLDKYTAAAAGKSTSLTTAALSSQRQKVESLQRQLSEMIEFSQASRAFVASAVQEVVFHRYRDTSPDVRAEVIFWYSRWLLFPMDQQAASTASSSSSSIDTTSGGQQGVASASSLTNANLKYLGWMLNDGQSHVVRRLALQSIALLYSCIPDHSVGPRLTEFMTRFRGRIAEMLRDVSADQVAPAALQVLHFSLLHAGHFPPATDPYSSLFISDIYACLSDETSLPLRQAAGAFALEQVPVFQEGEGDDGGAIEDAGTGAGAGAGGAKSKADASNRAARAAAAAAAAKSRRLKRQLVAVLDLAAVQLPSTYALAFEEGAAPIDEEDEAAAKAAGTGGGGSLVTRQFIRNLLRTQAGKFADKAMDKVVSALWGHPRARALLDYEALMTLVKDKNGGGSGVGAAGSKGKSGDDEDDDDDATSSSLSPLQQHLALRLLSCVARMLTGIGLEDAAPGIPVFKGGVSSNSGMIVAAAAATAAAGNKKGGKAGISAAALDGSGIGDGSGGDGSLSSSSAQFNVGPEAGLSAFTTLTSDSAMHSAREEFSAAMLPVLPELFAKYGGGGIAGSAGAGSAGGPSSAAVGPSSAVLELCTVVRCLTPSSFALTRSAKAFTELLYHVTRLFQKPSASSADNEHQVALAALCDTLVHLARGQHARAREAETKVRSTLSALCGRFVTLADAVLAAEGDGEQAEDGAKAQAGKKGKKGAKGKKATSMNVDEEEEDAEGDEDGSKALGGTGGADRPSKLRACLSVLRRIRLMIERFPNAAELVPEALGGGTSGTVVQAISKLLGHSRRLTSLFAEASQPWNVAAAAMQQQAENNKKKRASTSGSSAAAMASVDEAWSKSAPLHPALVQDGITALTVLYASQLQKVADEAANAAMTSPAAKKKGAEATSGDFELSPTLVSNLNNLRDLCVSHLAAFLNLRHPSTLIEYARAAAQAQLQEQGNNEAAEDEEQVEVEAVAIVDDVLQSGDSPATLPALAQSYHIPAEAVALVERAFILRCRQAAFSACHLLAAVCSRASTTVTVATSATTSVNVTVLYADLFGLTIDPLVEGLILYFHDSMNALTMAAMASTSAGVGGGVGAQASLDPLDLALRGLYVPRVSERLEAVLSESSRCPVLPSSSSSASAGSSSSGSGIGGASYYVLPAFLRPCSNLNAFVGDEDAADLPVAEHEQQESVELEFQLALGGTMDVAAEEYRNNQQQQQHSLSAAALMSNPSSSLAPAFLQQIVASSVMAPFAAISLSNPKTARLSAELAKRSAVELNEAGAAGLAIVKAFNRNMKARAPEAWLLSDLQTMLNASLELKNLAEQRKQILAAVAALASGSSSQESQFDEEELRAGLEAKETALYEKLASALATTKKQVSHLGVGKANDKLQRPLLNVLMKAVTVALHAAPDKCLILSFATLMLPYLQISFLRLLQLHADSALLHAVGGGGGGGDEAAQESASILTTASKWWKDVVEGKENPFEDLDQVEGGGGGDEAAAGANAALYRPWMPCFAFRRGLLKLLGAGGTGAGTGAVKQITREAVAAAMVALQLRDEEGDRDIMEEADAVLSGPHHHRDAAVVAGRRGGAKKAASAAAAVAKPKAAAAAKKASSAGPAKRGAPAKGRKRKADSEDEEEESSEEEESEEEEDEDESEEEEEEEEVMPQRKDRARAPPARGGRGAAAAAASKKMQEDESEEDEDEEEDEEGGGWTSGRRGAVVAKANKRRASAGSSAAGRALLTADSQVQGGDDEDEEGGEVSLVRRPSGVVGAGGAGAAAKKAAPAAGTKKAAAPAAQRRASGSASSRSKPKPKPAATKKVAAAQRMDVDEDDEEEEEEQEDIDEDEEEEDEDEDVAPIRRRSGGGGGGGAVGMSSKSRSLSAFSQASAMTAGTGAGGYGDVDYDDL